MRQSKKRAEINDKCSEAETPSKVKKVEIEIADENEVKITELSGEFMYILCMY